MRKGLLFFALLFCFSFAKSQCSSIYGLVSNSGADWSLVSVDRYTGAYTVRDTIYSMHNLVDGVSTIEIDSNRYVTLGDDTSSGSVQRLYTIDFNTGKVLYQPVCDSLLSDIHYDVKRKQLYALLSIVTSSSDMNSLVTVNPYNGSVTILDTIIGAKGIEEETSTIAIDSGTYFFRGRDTASNLWMFAIDEATGRLKYKVRDSSNVLELQYDTITKSMYGLSHGTAEYFNKLNPSTAIATVLDSFPGVQSILAWSSAYAQDSLQYFFEGDTAIYPLLLNFYSVNAITGKTLSRPLTGNNGIIDYDATEYDPCGSSYCTNSFSEPICIATVDTATNKAKIIWGRTNSPPATGSFNIYKDTTSGFVLIQNQALHALSEYEDTNSYPADGPETYKLATLDSCGESALSAPHTTIYLTTTSAPNVYILNWTAYVGFTPSKYRIFRGPTLGTVVQIDSVSSSILTYHDTLPPSGSVYLVEAVNPSSACIPTMSIRSHRVSLSALSGSYSNGYNSAPLIITGMQAVSNLTNLNIFPNPCNGNINLNYFLSGSGNIQITIIDELGQVVYSENKYMNSGSNSEHINMENLSSGIYSLRMQTNNNITVKKLVIIRNT